MGLTRYAFTLLVTCGVVMGTVAKVAAADSAPAQVSRAEAKEAALGTWKGGWANDVSGAGGTVTVEIDNADGGELSGTGRAEGGKCSRPFSLTGWYRASLVEMTLDLPDAGAGCPPTTVSISMRMGRQAGKTIGVGHWANVAGGRAAGRDLGFLELTKQ